MVWIILALIIIHVWVVFGQLSRLNKKCYTDSVLIDYTNGKLSDAETKRIASHVLICESCRTQIKEIEKGRGIEEHLID